MTQTKPDVVSTRYYNVVQAAAALGVTRATIRRYELHGVLPARVGRFSTGRVRRLYKGADILRVWRIG